MANLWGRRKGPALAEWHIIRTVTGDEETALIRAIAKLATPDDATVLQAWAKEQSPSDALECAGTRGLLATSLRLPVPDLESFARLHAQR